MASSGSKWLTGMALGAALSTTGMTIAHATPNYAMGACQVADRPTAEKDTFGTQIRPIYEADSYITNYQNKTNSPLKKYNTDQYSFDNAKTNVLVAPKHGKLTWDISNNPSISPAQSGWYYYVSDKGYSGEDTFVMQVAKYGLKIKIYYTIEVPASDENPSGLCQLGEEWKISQIKVEDTTGATLASTTFTPEAPFLVASPSTNLTDVGLISPNIHVGIGDRGGSAVGEESTSGTATTITLDAGADGYGWFTDANLADTATYFLPTSNPDVKNRGQSALFELRSGDFLRGRPIFAGPARRDSCASIAVRKRSDPKAC